MEVLERISIAVIFFIGVSIGRSTGGKLLIMTSNSTIEENALNSLCPRQYIDVLAECPGNLECTEDEECSANDICCPNACGSRTCVSPWVPQGQGDAVANSACDNHTCSSQGRECRTIAGRAWCVCINECGEPGTNEDYVCDQNANLYLSECHLDKHACESGTALIAERCPPVGEDLRIEAGDLQAPRFMFPPAVITETERSDVTMDCQPVGNPRPSIFWQTKDGGEVLPLGAEREGMSVNAETGQFRINNVQLSDSGEYTCIAVNGRGRAEITYTLVVQALEGTPARSGRSSKVECNSFPSEQARRCQSNGHRRRIRKLWVYNRNKNICNKLYFRDCRAITNKFPTRDQCVDVCVKDVCQLKPRKGRCQQFQQRFYYDQRTGTCEQFIYSGCQGNSNNFHNVYACRARCQPKPGNVTVVPPELRCPICAMQEARAVCNSEFVLIGMVTHFREGNARTGVQERQTMHLRILKVLQDKSQSLHLNTLDLNNPQEAKLELHLDLDHECPCPDVRRLRGGGGGNSQSSRRQTDDRFEMKAIIMGKTVNGVPTIDSSGYATRYSEKNFNLTSSAVKMGQRLCHLIRFVDEEHLT